MLHLKTFGGLWLTGGDPRLEGRKIYLLDGRKGEPGALVATLEDFAATAARQNLDVRPLEELR